MASMAEMIKKKTQTLMRTKKNTKAHLTFVKPVFYIYTSYICLTLKFVQRSETCKCEKMCKKKKEEEKKSELNYVFTAKAHIVQQWKVHCCNLHASHLHYIALQLAERRASFKQNSEMG